MPCEDKSERFGVGGPANLRVARVGQGLHDEIPAALMGGDMMA